MRLKAKLNKDIAFSTYLRNVVNVIRWPWLKKDFEGRIPLNLLNKAAKFSDPIFQSFSFEKHPLKDFNDYSREFKNFVEKIEKIYNKEWQKNYKDLKRGEIILKELVEKYGNFITKTIPMITKNKWRFSEIWFVPVIYAGGTIFNNKVFVGCDKRPKERFLSLVIHELFHVNEPLREEMEKFIRTLKLPKDSREIATVLMTNKLLERLNKKFKENNPPQKFHDYFREMIIKYEADLRKLNRGRKSYKSLIKSIDKFLVKKGYKGYYSKYIK